MSSGVIDEQERVELEAAEKGIRLTRPATDKRQTEFHQRTHQATVEYLRRKALGERVSQLQLADEYDISPHMIKWRLRIYRGYDARKHQEEYWRRKEERDAQIGESGMYAPALQYDQFVEELAQKVQSLEALLVEQNAMEAYHQANETLCNIIALFATQINREELTDALGDIIDMYGSIMSRVGREGPGLVLHITVGLRGLRYTPAQKHEHFMQHINLSAQNVVNWLNEPDAWQAYFHASNELSHLVALLTLQLQDETATDGGKKATSLFQVIAERVAV